MVPSTPEGALADILRKVVQAEKNQGLKFKIIETGGRTVKSLLQRYNPTATAGCFAGCFAGDYIACKGGRGSGGHCRRNNVTYEIECGLCQGDEKSVYVGETARNLFTRRVEHVNTYEWEKESSFLLKHQIEKHEGGAAV